MKDLDVDIIMEEARDQADKSYLMPSRIQRLVKKAWHDERMSTATALVVDGY